MTPTTSTIIIPTTSTILAILPFQTATTLRKGRWGNRRPCLSLCHNHTDHTQHAHFLPFFRLPRPLAFFCCLLSPLYCYRLSKQVHVFWQRHLLRCAFSCCTLPSPVRYLCLAVSDEYPCATRRTPPSRLRALVLLRDCSPSCTGSRTRQATCDTGSGLLMSKCIITLLYAFLISNMTCV